jgi:hypothetical protein
MTETNQPARILLHGRPANRSDHWRHWEARWRHIRELAGKGFALRGMMRHGFDFQELLLRPVRP